MQGPASTLLRLGTSRHLLDLQLIWTVALILTAFAVFIAAIYAIDLQFHPPPVAPSDSQQLPSSEPSAVHVFFDWLIKFTSLLAPIVTAFGGITAWIYLQGNSRLGVVDLFACEIGTVCRICAITDVAKAYVASYKGARASGEVIPQQQENLSRFTSQENYFPAFETNISALQALEARVVVNITAFYTYMKALRDTRRKIEQIKPVAVADEAREPWHVATRDSIYMLFLASESGRKAVNDLIEFDPEEAELQATILITELECYGFLLGKFDRADVRHARLLLRAVEYPRITTELCRRITNGQGEPWRPAKELISELQSRYERVKQAQAS